MCIVIVMVDVKEFKIKFTDSDLRRWYEFDEILMPFKLAESLKRDIANGTKSRPTLHHFPTCLLRQHYLQKGYTVLLSEGGWDEYELFKYDENIAGLVGNAQKYELFLNLRKEFRRSGFIQGGGEPDLLVYNDREAFFIEAKRIGPEKHKDVLHHNQKIIIGLISAVLGIDTVLGAVVHESLYKNFIPQNHSWNLQFETRGLVAQDVT